MRQGSRFMFEIEISKGIWIDTEKSAIHEVLVKKLSIPFIPYPGLRILSGKFDSGPLTSVTWNCDNGKFFASSSDEFPWRDDSGHLHTPEEICAHMVKRAGWCVPDKDA
jgi:hypothetical protein